MNQNITFTGWADVVSSDFSLKTIVDRKPKGWVVLETH